MGLEARDPFSPESKLKISEIKTSEDIRILSCPHATFLAPTNIRDMIRDMNIRDMNIRGGNMRIMEMKRMMAVKNLVDRANFLG